MGADATYCPRPWNVLACLTWLAESNLGPASPEPLLQASAGVPNSRTGKSLGRTKRSKNQ